MTPIRVLITGSRDWDLGDFAGRAVSGLLAKHGPGLVIIHGACPTGVDASIDRACGAAGVQVERHPADWSLGKRAGPLRNQAMVDLGAVACLAFSRDLGKSRGTRDCVTRALLAGIPTWLIGSDDGSSRRLHPRRESIPNPAPEAAR